MSPYHLLQAIGFLDDDLIAEAEEPLSRSRTWSAARTVALAACVLLVLVLFPRGGTDGGSSSAGGTASAPESSSSGEAGSHATSEPGFSPEGTVWLDGRTYTVLQVVDSLPEGAIQAGTLGPLSSTEGPCTDQEDYVGLPVWTVDDTALYIPLPSGGWLEAALTEP